MRKLKLLAASAVAIAVVMGSVGLVSAEGFSSKALRDAVTLEGVRAHQQALQDAADANDGTRASGTPGFDASLRYVKRMLESAGYLTTVQRFNFAYFEEVTQATLRQSSPELVTYVYDEDFLTMDYSGSGNVTGVVQQVNDNILPPTQESSSTAGCQPKDFNGFTPGNIALIQRGGCDFRDKVANAEAAGAVAAIIFNEGNPGDPERIPLFGGTLGKPAEIPALSVSFAFGRRIARATESVTLRIKTDTISETRQTANLLGETPTGRNDRVVVVGAHLDSVSAGPGINDNGSGVAGILEIALQMSALKIKPVNQVRFAFWGAEESGLVGSRRYIGLLTKEERDDIALNLNFDMIGSPNFGRFVYDGDGSDSEPAGPNGSAQIEEVFNSYFEKNGLAFKSTPFDGRSDYGPFIAKGIPAGGLFTGAEDIMTAREAELFGGKAGKAFDPCYHEVCDTFDNISDEGLDQMSDAAADAVLQFAMIPTRVRGNSTARDSQVSEVSSDRFDYVGGHLRR
jgi:Zn-dependent M28 family amino/carboxypeptidase